ncbi:MAG: cytochrome C oxidase Cbb3 [Myxococcota bacterium]
MSAPGTDMHTLAALVLALVVAMPGCKRSAEPGAENRDTTGDSGDTDDPSAPQPDPVAPAPQPDDPLAARGRALIDQFECQRCHDGTGAPAVARDKHCVRCHQDILAGTFETEPELLAEWQRNITSLVAVPSLVAVDRRFTRSWVRDQLMRPVDHRPDLVAVMPRLAISPEQAEAIAAHLVPDDPAAAAAPGLSSDRIAAGRALYQDLGCASCHTFSRVVPRAADGRYTILPGAERVTQPAPLAIALAPDLALTRTRVQPARLAAWLADAPAIKPDTLMPKLALSGDQAGDLAAFIMLAPVAPPPEPRPFKRLPVLKRDVGYDEVAERVLRKICWHCHSSPDYARGDGGPGNTGGFGFPGRGLDLSEYSTVTKGSLGDDGRRRSVFGELDSGPLAGTPRLLAHLLARHIEQSGGQVPGIRGMPLGLPALPAEDIQLIESWIAQGRPR